MARYGELTVAPGGTTATVSSIHPAEERMYFIEEGGATLLYGTSWGVCWCDGNFASVTGDSKLFGVGEGLSVATCQQCALIRPDGLRPITPRNKTPHCTLRTGPHLIVSIRVELGWVFMPAAITIPISTFELAIAYDRPEIKLMADRIVPVQALFTALGPWAPELDDMEIITAGKLSEQGVKIRISSQKASFFFGTTGCKFTKDAANWAEADEILRLLTTALGALNKTSGVTFGKRTAILSLHLQLKTVSFKDILRTFMAPELLKLDPSPTEAMAIVARWPKHRITLDGSAALANGIFLQTEREFDANTTFDDMKTIIFNDEAELLKLLGVEEVEE